MKSGTHFTENPIKKYHDMIIISMENEIPPNNPAVQPTPQTPVLPTTNWLKILLFTVLGLVVVAGSVFASVKIGRNQTANQQPKTEQPTNIPTQTAVSPTALPTVAVSINAAQGVKFTGNITETNNGCWSDGICSIKVDDKWITAEIGGLRPPNSKAEIRGDLIGISFSQDTNKYIGKRVEVYAKQSDDNSFTIYGNENYYIKLLE